MPGPSSCPSRITLLLCGFEQSHDLIMLSVDTSRTVTMVRGLMHAEQGPAPKYSTTTKDLYTFTQFSHLCDLERT